MIVLDLEWNQPFGGRRMEEIIQIGAVRLAEPGGAVQDWFNMHIRPSIYPKLSPVARKLPESAQALTAELDFPAAYQAGLDWCGDDTLAGDGLRGSAGGLRPDAGHRHRTAGGAGAGGGILRHPADLRVPQRAV